MLVRSSVLSSYALQVREHSELAWVLNCITPLGWLNRMTQFKSKSGKQKETACLGLLGYPVLQAADILLYRATHVPVGEDQLQHLELSREVARMWNSTFQAGAATPLLPLPTTLMLDSDAKRIMSLKDATKKMSKSDADDASRINLTDSADVIADKIKKAKTDSHTGFTYDVQQRPEKSNLLMLMAMATDTRVDAVAAQYADATAVQFKTALTEALVTKFVPMGREALRLRDDVGYLDSVLADGRDAAAAIAAQTMRSVRDAVGLAA